MSKPPTIPTPSATTTVVAQGPGHIGLPCPVMAKIRGAAQVIGTGTAQDQSRFETAKAVGPHACIDALKLARRPQEGSAVEIISDRLFFRPLTIYGDSGSSSASCADTCQLRKKWRIPARELIGTTFTLDELDLAMALLNREIPGEYVLRVVLTHPSRGPQRGSRKCPERPPRLGARHEPVLTQFPRTNGRFGPHERVF